MWIVNEVIINQNFLCELKSNQIFFDNLMES